MDTILTSEVIRGFLNPMVRFSLYLSSERQLSGCPLCTAFSTISLPLLRARYAAAVGPPTTRVHNAPQARCLPSTCYAPGPVWGASQAKSQLMRERPGIDEATRTARYWDHA